MHSIWQRDGALAKDGDTSSASSARAITLLISALTSRPALLGVSAQMHGVGVLANSGNGYLHDGVKRRWDDWQRGIERANCSSESVMLNKADAPLIPGAYTYLLGVQVLVSLSDGSGHTLPLCDTLAVQKPPAGSTKRPEPVRVPGPPSLTTLPYAEPAGLG
ncbi:hypothetical protein BGY98DRAFT_1190829 [Russula aff. rugulosa BPL654]|nr:hypothetical protein BGY98DRAFT_1190829 [Russula aff. rugulosa BPL654]